MIRKICLYALVSVMMMSCKSWHSTDEFVSVRDGRLWQNGGEYRFVGTNLWYGSLLASEGQGGDRERLCRELDTLHSLGFDNLRVLVGADAAEAEPRQVWPALQLAAGQYNDTLLAGLDFLMQQLGKRQMKAVLYLNNSWTWSGGYSYYLRQADGGDAGFVSDADDYRAYTSFAAGFHKNEKAQQMYLDHVRTIVSRVNRYTGLRYTDDPAIMAWQLCNEPRQFCDTLKTVFAKSLADAAAVIRGIDSKHLISTGSEGIVGCNFDEELHRQICSDPNIDYITVHVWPTNWGWARRTAIAEDLDTACVLTEDYINRHVALSRDLHKPVVIEEFGYQRDGFGYSPDSATTLRNRYYRCVMQAMCDNKEIAGLNFWAWGGLAKAVHQMWQPSDPVTGDPPQEPQGLFSVFATDTSTIRILTKGLVR